MKTIELNHPLIEHKLAILRDKNTGTKEFIIKKSNKILERKYILKQNFI